MSSNLAYKAISEFRNISDRVQSHKTRMIPCGFRSPSAGSSVFVFSFQLRSASSNLVITFFAWYYWITDPDMTNGHDGSCS